MSFLKLLWQALQHASPEIELTVEDVLSHIEEKLNSTQPVNSVDINEAVATPTEPTQSHPIVDGDMSRYATDFSACEERTRGAARPGETSEEVEGPISTKIPKGHKGNKSKSRREEEGIQHKTKAQIREERKLQNKLLKKLGTGRGVRVKLSEVNINGETVWNQS